ncbi:hypothetical protein IKW75_02280 [Candidatus Saccharibacteria bacterium]|nr:hypothetical protein [Candidatus Saccharibacteria bacterium]
MTETENSARRVVRRLDFGVQHPTRRPMPEQRPIPVKPAPKPASRGIRMDFAPSRSTMPLMKPKSAPVSRPVSAPKSPSSPRPAMRPAPKPVMHSAPKPAPAPKPAMRPATKPTPVIKATISRTTVEVPHDSSRPVRSRGIRMDFVRRPKASAPKPATKLAFSKPVFRKKPTVIEDDEEPLMSDSELKAALSGFANAPIEEVPRRKPRVFKPTPKPAPKSSRSDFDDLADSAFGTDGFGDDIDRIEAEIEAEAEAEANDFVKEPRPLFEDPLVQLSKAREEQTRKDNRRLRDAALEEAKNVAKRSPYTTLYSTKNGASPFLSSVNIEKRPLSAAVSAASPNLLEKPEPAKKHEPAKRHELAKKRDSIKNAYRARMKKQLDDDVKEIHRQTMVMSTPEVKSHNTGLIIGIALTILLGAGVGALIYLVFFQ